MFVTPPGAAGSVSDALLSNGLEALRRGADHPDLKIIKPLALEEGKCIFPTWTVIAETKERDILFCQALISEPGAVLLLTLEAPHSPDVLAFLWNVLASVRGIDTS